MLYNRLFKSDLFRRHINVAMAETTAFADDETALRHGEELVSRLPTLAYYARTTPTETIRRRRGIINRVDVGDRRRTTTIKVRFTALDRPDYRSTAGIDMGKLLAKGLGKLISQKQTVMLYN